MSNNVVALVDLLATEIGGDMKQVKLDIQANSDKRGVMTALTTTHKATIVGALNELKGGLDNIDLSSIIDDAATGSTTTTLSASAISNLVSNSVNSIVDGAPAAYDTLKELADYVAADETAASAVTAALAKRVRVDAVQSFTEIEKQTGRENIGAASAAELDTLEAGVGAYGSADFVATYQAAL